MKDLFLCSNIREDFQRWLGCGVGPLTITQRGQAAVTLNSLPKTEMHLKVHGEKLLLNFLKNDVLLAEYQALMQDTHAPIHRIKGIRDAVIGWKAKAVCVTIRKDGQELTFRTGSTDLRNRSGSYGSSSIRAEDRQEFERLFGRRANYCAEDITKITYGRNTIYEAPPVQAEEMGPAMQMEGM